MLFLDNATQVDIHKFKKIANTNTLLVTENFPFNKSMINFIAVNGKRNYEINEQMLTKRIKNQSTILLHAKNKRRLGKIIYITEKTY